MSPSRRSSLPRCAATRPGSGRREPTALRRCATYGASPYSASPYSARPPQESSRAGAAGPAQPDTIVARVSATGSSAAGQAETLTGNGRPPRPVSQTSRPGRHARPRPGLVSAARKHLSTVFAQVGDLIFASSDEEARWRAWDIQVRQVGLGRRYRDRRFDTRVPCLRCPGIGAEADGSACRDCSLARRLVHA